MYVVVISFKSFASTEQEEAAQAMQCRFSEKARKICPPNGERACQLQTRGGDESGLPARVAGGPSRQKTPSVHRDLPSF